MADQQPRVHPYEPVRPYDEAEVHAKSNPEPLREAILLEWARSLPPSPDGILDIAAGRGYEVNFLVNNGFSVKGIDKDPTMDRLKVSPLITQADILSTQLQPESLSGVLAKDLFIFLSPRERDALMEKMRAALVTGGEALIMTQLGDALRILCHSGTPHSTRLESYSVEKIGEWEKIVDHLRQDNTVLTIEFPTTVKIIQNLATQHGFSFQLVEEYRFNSELARESRWVPNTSGFICKLIKL